MLASRRLVRRGTLVFASLSALWCAGLPAAAAQSRKLNPPLPALPGASVVTPRMTPDGAWIVVLSLVHDSGAGAFGPAELYRVPTKGGRPPLLLNDVPLSGSADFDISPDGRHVVYSEDDLYCVPIDKSAPTVRLNGPDVQPTASSGSFRFSHDGTRVVFRADGVDLSPELYVVPIDGSASPIRINGPLPSGAHVRADFEISADDQRVVYLADHDTPLVVELYSAPLAGGGPSTRLNRALASGGQVIRFQIGSDGQRVVYVADQDQDEVLEIFSAPTAGGAAAVQLNGPLVANGDVSEHFLIAPDASRVLYAADQLADGPLDLFSVPIDRSSAALRLGGPVPTQLESNRSFAIDPDSTLAVFRSFSGGPTSLFTAPLDGGQAARRLDVPLGAGESVRHFELAPDGAGVTCAVGTSSRILSLFSVPLAHGLEPIRLTDALTPPEHINEFATSPAGWVVYKRFSPVDRVEGLYSVPADGSLDPLFLTPLQDSRPGFLLDPAGGWVVIATESDPRVGRELFGVPVDGSAAPMRLSDEPAPGPTIGRVLGFQLTPDAGHLVFHALGFDDPDVSDVLYSVVLDRERTAVRLYPPPPPLVINGDDVLDFAITPDGARVLFRSGDFAANIFYLYSVPIDGGVPLRLADADLTDGPVARFVASPDGQRAVYFCEGADRVWDVFSARLDGSSGPVPLGGGFVLFGSALGIRIDPASERVVYVADQHVDQDFQIFSVPIDGSAGPEQLNAPLGPGGDVHYRPEISPDGQWVVYTADQDFPDRFEIYAARIDGSGDTLRLNGPVVPGGDVGYLGFEQTQFQILPGGRVVYAGDQDEDEVFELYSVPLDRSAPSVKLSGPMVAGGDVLHRSDHQLLFWVTPDETRVLYVADQEVDGTSELFVAPLDGSAPARKLSGPMVPGGGIVPFYSGRSFLQFTPDGRVLYEADQEFDERFELFVTALDGVPEPKKLHPTLPPGGNIGSGYQLTPDGRRVVYIAEQRADQIIEIFEASLDGDRPPRRLNTRAVPNGDVLPAPLIQVTPDGKRAIYPGDLDTDEVVELYESQLTPPPRTLAPAGTTGARERGTD